MASTQGDPSLPVVPYEPAFAQQRFLARVRLAMWCGLTPLLPLSLTFLATLFTHDRRWLFAAIGTLIIAHGVVGFGFFLMCMEYAAQRERLLSGPQFLRESARALVALIANWPLLIAVVFIAWRWK